MILAVRIIINLTQILEEHKACGYGYKVVCYQDQQYSKPVKIYRGRNVAKYFIESIYIEVSDCKRVIKKHFNKPLIMTTENELDFRNSTHCYICEKNILIKIKQLEIIVILLVNIEGLHITVATYNYDLTLIK